MTQAADRAGTGPVFVIVSGPPGSGKSALVPQVARLLGLPLVAKDTIKEALMASLPVPDVAASRDLGRAAVGAMFAVAAESPIGAVVESNLHRTYVSATIKRLPGAVIEVFCRCPREVAEQRYRARAGTRHPGHLDGVRTPDELWNDEVSQPVAGGWPVIEVDTTAPVDIALLAGAIRAALAGTGS